ncbi:MAG TPA: hypothetical protein VGP85_10240, partial [Pyrinomonadaceae bacterium]|nr:hypothetical protein [Pyrinomonadaceae bacterium]
CKSSSVKRVPPELYFSTAAVGNGQAANVRYALACRDLKADPIGFNDRSCWSHHDKLKHIGHSPLAPFPTAHSIGSC